jgi:hypothetical protein
MMIFIFSLLLAFFSISYAQVGKMIKVVGGQEAYLLRGSEKLLLKEDLDLEEGDEIFSETSYLVFLIHPSTQLSLSKNTSIKIVQAKFEKEEKVSTLTSSIELLKGLLRVQVIKDSDLQVDQKIISQNVAFAVRGTEFEVSLDEENIDLDVVEGEVEVSSPDIQTFVPEIVKANEGFRFLRKKPKFLRRAFKLRFKDHPAFLSRKVLKDRWRKNKFKRRPGR